MGDGKLAHEPSPSRVSSVELLIKVHKYN